MLRDPAVDEAELGPDVVVHLAAGPEGVVGEPVRAPVLVAGLVLGEPYLEILGAAGEHPPHGAGLLVAEIREHRVREVGARCVASRHRVAVVAGEGPVEALDQLVVRMRDRRRLLRRDEAVALAVGEQAHRGGRIAEQRVHVVRAERRLAVGHEGVDLVPDPVERVLIGL